MRKANRQMFAAIENKDAQALRTALESGAEAHIYSFWRLQDAFTCAVNAGFVSGLKELLIAAPDMQRRMLERHAQDPELLQAIVDAIAEKPDLSAVVKLMTLVHNKELPDLAGRIAATGLFHYLSKMERDFGKITDDFRKAKFYLLETYPDQITGKKEGFSPAKTAP